MLVYKIDGTVEEVSTQRITVYPYNICTTEKNGRTYIKNREDIDKYTIKCIIICNDGYVVQHNPNFDGPYNYYVYKHTNKNNGKVYIGITNKDPNERWGKNGSGYANQYFGKVIDTEGWDNFEHEICYSNLAVDEAVWLEQMLIKDYNANSSLYGYNKSEGGEIGHVKAELLNKPVCVYEGFGEDIHYVKEFPSAKELFDSGYTEKSYKQITRCCRSSIYSKDIKRCGDYLVCYKEYQNLFEVKLLEWTSKNIKIEAKRKKRFENKSYKKDGALSQERGRHNIQYDDLPS